MADRVNPVNFHEFCEQQKESRKYVSEYKRKGIYDLQIALDKAREKIEEYHEEGRNEKAEKLEERVDKAEEKGVHDGSFELTYEGATRAYERTKARLPEESQRAIEAFDKMRDANLIAVYLFALDPEVKRLAKNDDSLYKVILSVGSKKKKGYALPGEEKSGTDSSHDSGLNEDLEELIRTIPRETYTGDEEYQHKLKILLMKKAEREIFPTFKNDEIAAFKLLEKKINEEENENLRDAYLELKGIYRGYADFSAIDSNPEFQDPETKEKDVLPSLHQKIALYHMLREKKFGVFDGCGTGKTAIGALAQPLIEKAMQEEGKIFRRTVIVGPNNSKKSWEKGLIGKLEERYLNGVDEKDVMVINGGKKGDSFLDNLKEKKWILLNYEQLTAEVNKKGKTLAEELVDVGVDYVIFDESHRIKSQKDKAKSGKPTHSAAARYLAHNSEYLAALTGSPIPDTLKDYAVLYHILNPERCPRPEDFKSIYEENPRILYTLFNEKTVRRTAGDINDSPEPIEHEEIIELNEIQRTLYDHIIEYKPENWLNQARKALLDPRLVHPEILKRAGMYGKVSHRNSAKYRKLEEILTSDEGPIANGENFIIFSKYRQGITGSGNESLKRKYVELGISEEFENLSKTESRILTSSITEGKKSKKSVIKKFVGKRKNKEQIERDTNAAFVTLSQRGYICTEGDNFEINNLEGGKIDQRLSDFEELGFEVSLDERLEEVLRRKYGDDFKIGVIDGTVGEGEKKVKDREEIVDDLGFGLEGIICTTETGGESLSFTAASHAYFLDEDYAPKTSEQAIARLYRKGQKNQVRITYLRGEDSLDEQLRDYVEKKRIITKIAIDGHSLTEEEWDLLEDSKGEKLKDMIKPGLGGRSINVLEPEIEDFDDFITKRRTRVSRNGGMFRSDRYGTTDAQRLMQWIGKDPQECWKDPEFVELYSKTLENLSVPILHRARLCSLIQRANDGEIEFPGYILSEGSGNSILYDAAQDLTSVFESNGIETPKILDRDFSLPMLKKGNNPRRLVGNMSGVNSALKSNTFDMVDNASISLLKTNEEIRDCLVEANRVLRPNGLLQLTVDSKRFPKKFHDGLKQLGFEIITKRNEGFDASPKFKRRLKAKHGETFANAYLRKLTSTHFVLARKIGSSNTDVNAETFEFERITPDPQTDTKETPRDPTESNSIVTAKRGGRKRGVRTRRKNTEIGTIETPTMEIKVDRFGNVHKVRKLEGNEENE